MEDLQLYGFSPDEPFLIPLGPFEPFEGREPTEDNQLARPAFPSQYPDIIDNEEALPEVQYRSSIQYRVGIVNPPQEDPLLQGPDTCSAVSGPLDIEPYPSNNASLTMPPYAGRGILEAESGPPTLPTQISGASNHGPMTSQAQQGILVPEYPVTPNNGIELESGQDSKSRCPVCGKIFRSKSTGVIGRHLDGVHSVPQECPHFGCDARLRGKRALKNHLSVRHGGTFWSLEEVAAGSEVLGHGGQ